MEIEMSNKSLGGMMTYLKSDNALFHCLPLQQVLP
jgi:hypothetical protein